MATEARMHGERENGSPPDTLTRSRYSAAFPDLQPDEYAELVESISRDGLQDAIWTLDGEVLDGWHRLLACREAGVQPSFREYADCSPAHFALGLHRARRSLDSSQAAAVADALAEDLAREAYQRAQEGRSKGGGDKKSAAYRSRQSADESDPEPQVAQSREPSLQKSGEGKLVEAALPEPGELASPSSGGRDYKRESRGRTDERAAKAAGTNRQYLRNFRLIKSRDAELAEKVRTKEADIPRAMRTIRERDAAERRRAELAANRRADYPEPILHLSGFQDVWLEAGSVDAIVTDPPYDKQSLQLYSDLAEYASRVLRPGGLLLTLAGQSHLPEVLRLLGEHLTYHWVLDYRTPGPNSSVQGRKVLNGWKPLLLYARGSYAGNAFIDYLTSPAAEKELHPWQQAEAAFAELIERFTKTGDLILDPFLGGGTTGAAAIQLKRRFVGIESDPEAYRRASERLGGGAS